MSNKEKNKLPLAMLGKVKDFYPKNEKQNHLVEIIEDYEVVIAAGVAGSGKTYVALATALQLLGKKYKHIILVKSITTIPGENIGFLPGSQEEKMDPFIMSYTWNIDKILGRGSAKALMDKDIIQVLPLAFIRGLSIDNSIVIIDESQNIDNHTFKTLISRIGEDSKYIFLGDVEQVDRRKKEDSCLQKVLNIFRESPYVGTVKFEDGDCVRNPIIPEILQTLRIHNI